MSIMYILCLHTPVEPVELLKEAYRAIGMDEIAGEIKTFERQLRKEWDGPDCNGMSIGASDRVVARLEYQEDFGIDLDKCLYFYIDKFEDRLVQDTQAGKIVLRFLEMYDGDLLLNDFQVVSLIRKAGRVTLDPGANPWPNACLQLVKIPYRIAKLGFA